MNVKLRKISINSNSNYKYAVSSCHAIFYDPIEREEVIFKNDFIIGINLFTLISIMHGLNIALSVLKHAQLFQFLHQAKANCTIEQSCSYQFVGSVQFIHRFARPRIPN